MQDPSHSLHHGSQAPSSPERPADPTFSSTNDAQVTDKHTTELPAFRHQPAATWDTSTPSSAPSEQQNYPPYLPAHHTLFASPASSSAPAQTSTFGLRFQPLSQFTATPSQALSPATGYPHFQASPNQAASNLGLQPFWTSAYPVESSLSPSSRTIDTASLHPNRESLHFSVPTYTLSSPAYTFPPIPSLAPSDSGNPDTTSVANLRPPAQYVTPSDSGRLYIPPRQYHHPIPTSSWPLEPRPAHQDQDERLLPIAHTQAQAPTHRLRSQSTPKAPLLYTGTGIRREHQLLDPASPMTEITAIDSSVSEKGEQGSNQPSEDKHEEDNEMSLGEDAGSDTKTRKKSGNNAVQRAKNRASSQRHREKIRAKANANQRKANYLEGKVRQLEYELQRFRSGATESSGSVLPESPTLSTCGNNTLGASLNASVGNEDPQTAIRLLKEENQMLRAKLQFAEQELERMQSSSSVSSLQGHQLSLMHSQGALTRGSSLVPSVSMPASSIPYSGRPRTSQAAQPVPLLRRSRASAQTAALERGSLTQGAPKEATPVSESVEFQGAAMG